MISSDNKTSLHIWDSAEKPPTGISKVVLWQSYNLCEYSNCISIPELIDKNADQYRKTILAWFYNLSDSSIAGKKLVDYFELRPNLSFLWMFISEAKSVYSEAPPINDVIRVIALNSWINENPVSNVILTSHNAQLSACISQWCQKNNIPYRHQKCLGPKSEKSIYKSVYEYMPCEAQAITWLLKYLFESWRLVGVGLKEWTRSPARTVFFSYFINIKWLPEEKTAFTSQFWGTLPEKLSEQMHGSNWFHIFVKDMQHSTAQKVARTLGSYNDAGKSGQTHTELNSFLSWRALWRALKDWNKLRRDGRRLLPRALQTSSTTQIDWGQLFEGVWLQMLCGSGAMKEALTLSLLESALSSLLPQETGVYLQENQGWELSLISAWKAGGHGRLVGYQHSVVRFWDLRYFSDPRTFNNIEPNHFPLPDLLVCNGPLARETLLDGGHPATNLQVVEALRYLHLLKRGPALSDHGSRSPIRRIKLLVLGDFLSKTTIRQLTLLSECIDALPIPVDIVFKGHPSCSVDATEFNKLDLTITDENVFELLGACDIAYTGPSTSASLDAYLSGVPVICIKDGTTLNLSPLYGRSDVSFVSTSIELSTALLKLAKQKKQERKMPIFFHLEDSLPAWAKLLELPKSTEHF